MNTRDISDLTETTRHRLLADDQRRLLVESLWSSPDRTETTLDELAADVSQRLTDTDGADPDSVRCRLHHVHVPMLADAGLLEYDADTKRVCVGPRDSVTAVPESK